MPEIADNPVPASALSSANPFPGLRPYGEEDANWFFGRSAEVNDLLKRLRRLHFIAVVGASGSGKSSIVRAGVLPQIRDGYLDAEWQIATFRPGEQPIANLAAALAIEDSGPESLLRSGPAGLVRILRRSGFAARKNHLIVVDQFEELFQFAQRKSDAAQEEIKEFLKLLLTATASDDVAVYVVVTMRLEWLNECATYAGLAEAINAGIYLVPQMQRRQFGQAILGPLESAGGSLTSALLDRMLNDLDNRSDQLPVLQHALLRLWARGHTEEPFDVSDYEAVGTFSHCLSNHAQEVYDGLTDRQKQIAEVMFRNITQVSKNRKIRRPRPLGEIQQAAHVDLAEMIPVVLAFSRRGRSFLVTTQGALAPQSIIDISHEALIRQWTLLNQWVDSEAEIQARLERLEEDAAEWDRDRSHSRACLYTGVRLERVEELAPRLEPSGTVDDFLRESRRASFWTMVRRRGVIAFVALALIAIAVSQVLLSRERTKEAENARQVAEIAKQGSEKNAEEVARVAKQAQDYESNLKAQLDAIVANGNKPADVAAIVQQLDAKRIYVQYPPGQRDAANLAQSVLQKSNFAVPGLQQLAAEKFPPATQVRYFNAQDKADAAKIVAILRQSLSGRATAQLVPNPKNVVPAGQLEVWLAPPIKGGEDIPPALTTPTKETTTNVSGTNGGSGAGGGTGTGGNTGVLITNLPTKLTAAVSANLVQRGNKVTLSWHSENAREVDLEGVGTVPLIGSMVMTPQKSTTYHFTVKGNGASSESEIAVEVVEPAADAPKAPAEAESSDVLQINQLLAQYVDGYERESVELVKKTWPNMNSKQEKQLKNTFNQFNAIRLNPIWTKPVINGDTATTVVHETATFTQRGQVQPPQKADVAFTLKKVRGQWQIDSMKGP